MHQARYELAPEHRSRGSRFFSILIWFLAADLLLVGILGAMLDYQHAAAVQFHGAPASKLFSDLIMALSALLAVCLWVFHVQPQMRRSARFRHAVRTQSGAGVPLVEPQPAVTTVLPLPITLRMHRRWPAIVFWTVGFSTLVGLFVLAEMVISGFGHSLTIAIFAAVGFGLLILAAVLAEFALNAGPEIEVTNVGLSYLAAGKAQTILWTEANLFAITDRDGPSSHPWALIYELASPAATIRWKRLRRAMPLAVSQPAEPFDLYDRQMDAVIAYIVARTSLPLYDFR